MPALDPSYIMIFLPSRNHILQMLLKVFGRSDAYCGAQVRQDKLGGFHVEGREVHSWGGWGGVGWVGRADPLGSYNTLR